MGGKLPPFSVTEEDGSPIVYQPWKIKFSNGVVTDNGDGTVSVNISAGTGGAPTTAAYITQIPDAGLSAEQALSLLATGLLKNTTTTGVLSIGSGGVDFENILTAGSPILRRSNIFYLNTDGNTVNFLNGAGVFTTPSGGSSIVYAPTGGTYIVQTNNSALSNAQILAALSTGLLKNTALTGILVAASGGVDFQTVFAVSSPIILVGTALGIQPSATNQDGYLSQSNFNLFNAKVGTTRAITIVAPLSGGGDLSADRVIAILSSTATSDGYLKSADFNLFNAKASTATTITVLSPLSGGGSLAANRIISLTTDGVSTNFLNGLGAFSAPAGGGLTWVVATVDTTASVNKGHIVNSAGLLTVTLPASASVGDVVRVSGLGVGGWKLAQQVLQQVFVGNTSTSVGTGGYLQSTDTRDALELVCVQVNSGWNVIGMVGNITFV